MRPTKQYRLTCSGTTSPDPSLARTLILAGFEVVEARFGRPAEITSGCAVGIDTMWICLAKERWPDARILLVVPQARHNAALVKEFQRLHAKDLMVVQAPAGRTTSETYMLRNDMLADVGHVLVAHPNQTKEVRRGPGAGTWSTIRRFRKLGKPRYISPLSSPGETRWE